MSEGGGARPHLAGGRGRSQASPVCLTCSCVLLLSQKLSLLELRQAVQSLRSSEACLLSQKALLDAKMAAAVASPPPALQYEDDTRSVSSTVGEGGVSERWQPTLLLTSDPCALQDKKEKSSRFDTLRHSLAGMMRSPKAMLGSSTSVGRPSTAFLSLSFGLAGHVFYGLMV